MDHRRNPEGNRNYHVERIWDHHRGIIRLLVASNGTFTNEQIANEIGCTAQTVSNVRNSPLAKARLEVMHGEADKDAVSIAKRIKEIAPLAVAVLEKTMGEALADEEGDDKLRNTGVRAALGALEFAVPKKAEISGVIGHVTLEQIEQMKQRARATMISSSVSVPIAVEGVVI